MSDAIERAIAFIRKEAEALKDCSTQNGEWDGTEPDAEQEYGELMELITELSARASEVERFAQLILHGDEEHRQWLITAAECFVKGEPIPEPIGQGTKETDANRWQLLQNLLGNEASTVLVLAPNAGVTGSNYGIAHTDWFTDRESKYYYGDTWEEVLSAPLHGQEEG